MPKIKSFITPEGTLSQEEFNNQIKELKRISDLKAEKEKSEQELRKMFNQATLKAHAQKWTEHEAKKAKMMEEYKHQISFRADQLPITKIGYVVNPNKEATMKITRGDNPLNLVVHPNFRLKTLGFSEWLEVINQAKKLGLPPPPTLATFGMTTEDKKRKKDINSGREEEFHLATTAQLIRLQRSIQRGTLEAEEMFRKLELTIEAKDDAAQARDIVKDNLDEVMKGLFECKASESNFRRIQVKYIIKEVEDYLKTYSSAGMDNSCLGLKAHVDQTRLLQIRMVHSLTISSRRWILVLYVILSKTSSSPSGHCPTQLWDHLKDLFHDNKDNRAINLDNEIRSLKIGKLSVNEYCNKLRSMAGRIKNLGGDVSDKNLVIYMINGLDARFATLVEIIRNRDELPSFETARSMLLLKESTFSDPMDTSTPYESSSSSPTILMASSESKGNTKGKPTNIPQLCNHFSRGSCKFGDRCKFIHDHRNRAGLNSRNNNPRGTGSSNNWNPNTSYSPNSQALRFVQPRPTLYAPQAHYSHTHFPQPGPPTLAQPPTQPIHPHAYVAQQHAPNGQVTSYSGGNGILGQAPMYYPSQPTTLPSAFSTMSLQDPTWNMDTGATSHLNSSTRNLSSIFNKRLYSSIHVGDGNSIPVTNTGHSIIPTFHRPLHLHNVLVTPNIIKNLISVRQFTRDNNCTIEFDAFGFSVKDFLTRHILLRCDSSGDLYPVTKPSTSPDKSTHVCHACQLGKHVKLPFHSSLSTVQHCFDIVHSDLWTSPIPPLNPTTQPFPTETEPTRTHTIVTRSQLGTLKPVERLSLHTSSVSPIPKSPFIALKDPNWSNAMYDEYNALVKNGTWVLVPKPADINLVRSMWLFKHKFHADGTLSRYKARLVANGSSQQMGVDFDETFSPVVKPATIRTVLTLAVSRHWPIHQLDVKNAFLNGDLSETQAPRAWFQRFAGYATREASAPALLRQIIDSLHKEFDMTDLGALNYFLGIISAVTSFYRGYFCLRRNLSYAVQQVCLYMHDPREPHLAALKRILRYVQGTLALGLHLYASATTSLVGYTDADWAGCPSTRSAEVEYRGVANVVAETAWVRNLLRELHSPLSTYYCGYCR
ncbi:ribonuclease H-like domain-containing protein [Tanacetum coccineum]